MASLNVGAYCWEDLGPQKITDQRISEIQQSLDTVVLFALHIGNPHPPHEELKYGDLVFNNAADLLVRDGQFTSHEPIRDWPARIAKLKQGNTLVKNIFLCIGGGGVEDYSSIEYMLKNCRYEELKENFAALKRAFTPSDGPCVIDGFDIDYEEGRVGKNYEYVEHIDCDRMVRFCEMLFDLGFAVSFCPYRDLDFWKKCTQLLWKEKKKVSSWRLQCYSGGDSNREPEEFQKWVNALKEIFGEDSAASLLLPGLGVKDYEDGAGECPDACKILFAGWKDYEVGGGWLWRYDDILLHPAACPSAASLADYAKAIREGLTKPK